MRSMRAWVVGVIGSAGVAAAQSAEVSQLDACKARRHTLTMDAMHAPSLAERGLLLAALPECRRLADGSVEVVEHAPEREAPPFPPQLAFAVSVGVGTWTISGSFGEPTRVAPTFDIGAGARIHPRVVLLAYVSVTTVPMRGVYATFGVPPQYVVTHPYEGTESLHEVGLRAQVEHRSLVFGAALGVESDHSSGFAMPVGAITSSHLHGVVEGEVGYAMHLDRLALQWLVVAADGNGSWLGGVGNATSLRLAMRGQL
jgi:hypothetical protein